MISVIEERPEHRESVDAVNRMAFKGRDEADLIERLRADNLIILSLVAIEEDEVKGHILFSDLAVEIDGRAIAGVSLAPMAVRPDAQRQGIGSALVRAGLEKLRKKGRTAVIVVGHPQFYRRFGFSAALGEKIAGPFPGPAFMALELTAGALVGARGRVVYPAAFHIGTADGS